MNKERLLWVVVGLLIIGLAGLAVLMIFQNKEPQRIQRSLESTINSPATATTTATVETSSYQSQPWLSLTKGEQGSRLTIHERGYNPSGKAIAFSLNFPTSWGLVNVDSQDLSATDFGRPPQYVQYRFASDNYTLPYFYVIVAEAGSKDPLVTQSDRLRLGENSTYLFQAIIPELGSCTQDPGCHSPESVRQARAEIQNILRSFSFE